MKNISGADHKQIIEEFLRFAETKDISLGGDVTYGFALEHTEFRPLLKDDYPVLISHFIKSLSVKEE